MSQNFKAFALAAMTITACANAAHLFVSHFSGTVYSLTFNRTTNGLKIDSSTGNCGRMPSWLTLDNTSGQLYCFDESYGSGVVSSYNVADSGALTLNGSARTTGNDVHGWLYGGPNGDSFLARSEYSGSSISTNKLPLTSSSSVLQLKTFTMNGSGPDPSRQDKPHPHSAVTDPTGKYLIVPDLGADLIRIFSINTQTGALTDCPSASADAGSGPRHASFWAPTAGSTTGQMMYTVNELKSTITGWSVTYPSNGCLTLSKKQTISTFEQGSTPSPKGSTPVKAAELHVRDNFLYAANRNDQTFGSKQDSLATFNITSSGVLDFVENTNAHAWYPRTFSVNKAGDLLAIGGQTSSNVAIIARDTTTGRLGDLLATVNVGSAGSDGGENGLSAVIWNWCTAKSL